MGAHAIMTVAGNIYGVVLNDATERERLAPQFEDKPYLKQPVAPVVYMKPLAALASGPVAVPRGGLTAAATLAVLIARDTAGVERDDVAACIGGAALALDLSLPSASYYRPAVAQKNGDGRLALGGFTAPVVPRSIRVLADGATVHEWSLDRLARPIETLIADLGTFMTLKAGDVLLVGLPGDAPVIQAGQSLRVEGEGLPALDVATTGESA
jgi:5-oxopent-3-ene-1,2,5-tricarboxylate decarboxylase/2-hydroxyhepta-2,4-diene-1,7-dioate isomerase